MAKIKNLKDLEQIDGKITPTADKYVPSRLDDVFNTGTNKYTSHNKEDYQKQLDEMTVAELREHAIKSGLLPSSNATRLKKQLAIEFEKYTLARNNPTKKVSKSLPASKLEIGLEIMRALK